MPESHFDAIIIGSGFGGSVAAYRLAQAGKRVCVLERGRAYPPGSFARRPREMAANVWDPSSGLHGLFNIWSFRNIDAIVSSGLGGGSLIYANVLLRKDERWFTQPTPDGSGVETWPMTRADLDPHYDAVEKMLCAQAYPYEQPGYRDLPKTGAMQEAAARLGLHWELPKLAVSFANSGRPAAQGEPLDPLPYPNMYGRSRLTCRMCGECDIGCNDGSKNTLDHTYLSAALSYGADIRVRSEARTIAPTTAGYEVGYVEHLPGNEGSPIPTSGLPHRRLTATRVILAAGALGSPFLLLKNQNTLPGLGPALGTRFCGNGDLLSFAANARRGGQPRWMDASHGPVITSFIRVPDQMDDPPGSGPGYYVEDAGYPFFADWLVEAANAAGTLSRAAGFIWAMILSRASRSPRTDISGRIGALIGDARLSASSIPLLGMGRDVPDGTMRLNDGLLDVDWTSDSSEQYFERLRSTMQSIAEAWDADFIENPLRELNRLITVHPLGGCPMGTDIRRGVVDGHGQSFGHPGLYVADGSVMPGPVGGNPALTIAAFADRMCDRMLGTWNATQPAMQPAERAVRPVARTLVRFTERMAGFVSPDGGSFEEAAIAGEQAGLALAVDLTITMDDIDRFIADPDHTGAISGWVESPAFGGRHPVESGLFNLFRPTDDPGCTNMLYRLFFTDDAGDKVTLAGLKVVRNDPGFDLWRDTTTLYARLYAGHVAANEESGADLWGTGIITISVADFLRQLTTFRAEGPDRTAELAGLAAFGALFMGELWKTYGRDVVTG